MYKMLNETRLIMKINSALHTLNIPFHFPEEKDINSLYIFLFGDYSYITGFIDISTYLNIKKISFSWHYALFSHPLIIVFDIVISATFMPLSNVFLLFHQI